MATRTILVVDDDEDARAYLAMLLSSMGYEVQTAESGEQALSHLAVPDAPAVVLLDLLMPGMSGLDLQRWLKDMGHELPIIILTGFGDVKSSVEAMKNGALDFIEKPFSDQQLLALVRRALDEDQKRRSIYDLFETLTKREREVLAYVVAGYTSRKVADALHLVVFTVENHRANVMRKMRVRVVADLVRLVTTTPGLFARLPQVDPPPPTDGRGSPE